MYTRLGEATLKTDEQIELGVVLGPDADWAERINALLSHKPSEYRYHIGEALLRPLDELETRFYVGHLDGRPITHVMIVGARGAGILGHVYTVPEWRRRGAYQVLMEAQMRDTAAAGYRILTLGTGYDTPPYWIYYRFGFRSIAPGSGAMRWLATPDAEEQYLAPAPVLVRELRWSDWGALNVTAMHAPPPDDELPRSLVLQLKGQGNAEGSFAALRQRMERRPAPPPGIQARVLVSATGAVPGWAILAPDPRWFGDVWLLDLYALPAFWDRAGELVAGFTWPDAPVAAYSTNPAGPRARLLQSLGFVQGSVLPGWLHLGDTRRDVTMWVRSR
jgi:GNAT superfamily N-acetyltransferase